MNTTIIHLKNKALSSILILFSLFSCQIEDDHGTFEFVSKGQIPESRYGELVGTTNIFSKFFVDEKRKEIIYLCPENQEQFQLQINSLNFETGEIQILINHPGNESHISIVDYDQTKSICYYLLSNQNTGIGKLYQYDIDHRESKPIPIDHDLYEDHVFIGNDLIFFNNDYDPIFIYKSDIEGNVHTLNIKGEILMAVEDHPEIIAYDHFNERLLKFNYELDSIVFEQITSDFPRKFYNSDKGIISFYEYPNSTFKYFDSEVVLYRAANSVYEIVLNPICLKILYKQEENLQLYERNLLIQSLVLEDILQGESQIPVEIYDDYISQFMLLNDCKTIIYVVGDGNIYKASIE